MPAKPHTTGQRNSSGRPSLDPAGSPSERITVRMTQADKAIWRDIGGPVWLRDQLRAAWAKIKAGGR